MAGSDDSTLVTSARPSRTLDVEARTRRYLITMAIRTACFLLFLVVPGWWKVAALVGAALLPAIAVLLANNTDHRPLPVAAEYDTGTRAALPPGQVIAGSVEDEE